MNKRIDEELPLTGQIDLLPNKHRGKVIGDRIKEARAGKVLPGKVLPGKVLPGPAVLQAATAALYRITEKKPIDTGDFKALQFLHEALRDYLYEDIPLHRALCIENEGGRPRVTDTSAFLVKALDREIEEQIKRGCDFNIGMARDRVAKKEGVSASKVEKAWLKCGDGRDGWKRRNAELWDRVEEQRKKKTKK
jgi:hypothetical protein